MYVKELLVNQLWWLVVMRDWITYAYLIWDIVTEIHEDM